MTNSENEARPVRAYQIVARNAEGAKCSATVDLLRVGRISREQATSNLLTAIYRREGRGLDCGL